MTNNYFKVSTTVKSRENGIIFFFDDTNDASIKSAKTRAEQYVKAHPIESTSLEKHYGKLSVWQATSGTGRVIQIGVAPREPAKEGKEGKKLNGAEDAD